jgi:hypothetical protein
VGRREIKKMAEKESKLLKKGVKRERSRKRRRRALILALVGGGAVAAQASRQKAETLPPGSGTVTLRDAEPGPLTFMMSEMVKGFLQNPSKKKLADRMNVSVAIQDIENLEMAATMIFKSSDVEVVNGVIDEVDIYIGTELALLLSLSGAGKGKQMLQWLKSEDGQKVIKAVRGGRFKIRGALKNLQQMVLFQKFLTP